MSVTSDGAACDAGLIVKSIATWISADANLFSGEIGVSYIMTNRTHQFRARNYAETSVASFAHAFKATRRRGAGAPRAPPPLEPPRSAAIRGR